MGQTARHQVQWRRRGRICSRCPGWYSPADYGEDHGKAAVPLQPMEINRDAESHLQPLEEPDIGAGRCLRENCDPVGGLWREDPTLEHPVLEGQHPMQ